ncbi:MAG: ester cyclase [Blastocatellia bacterium]
MKTDQNKALVRRALEEVWSKGEVTAAPEIYAPGFVSHQHSHPNVRDVHGVDALVAFVREFREAFPDFHDTIDDQVAEGDKVVTRFTSAGTHRGALMGIKPAGKRASWMGITIDRIEEGRIVEQWVSWDLFGMMQQLGAVA